MGATAVILRRTVDLQNQIDRLNEPEADLQSSLRMAAKGFELKFGDRLDQVESDLDAIGNQSQGAILAIEGFEKDLLESRVDLRIQSRVLINEKLEGVRTRLQHLEDKGAGEPFSQPRIVRANFDSLAEEVLSLREEVEAFEDKESETPAPVERDDFEPLDLESGERINGFRIIARSELI